MTSWVEKQAKAQRGIHNNPDMSAQERLDSARQELNELQKPKIFDPIGDGVTTGAGAGFGYIATNALIQLADNVDFIEIDPKQKLLLKVTGSALGAVTGYLAGKNQEAKYIDARINDAAHEVTHAQNDVILEGQKQTFAEIEALKRQAKELEAATGQSR